MNDAEILEYLNANWNKFGSATKKVMMLAGEADIEYKHHSYRVAVMGDFTLLEPIPGEKPPEFYICCQPLNQLVSPVRCSECVYADEKGEETVRCRLNGDELDIFMPVDGYCSYGVKKEASQ